MKAGRSTAHYLPNWESTHTYLRDIKPKRDRLDIKAGVETIGRQACDGEATAFEPLKTFATPTGHRHFYAFPSKAGAKYVLVLDCHDDHKRLLVQDIRYVWKGFRNDPATFCESFMTRWAA